MKLLVIGLVLTTIHALIAADLNSQETVAPSVQADWEKIRFGRQFDTDREYKITKVVIQIPKNADQKGMYGLDMATLHAPNMGPFELPNAELDNIAIDDENVILWIQDSFQSFNRLETVGSAVYGDLGTIVISTTDGEVNVSITERGFTLGNASPTRKNTFYSWELAKLIDNATRSRFDVGLKQEYFDLLSGQQSITRSQRSYEHRFTIQSKW